MQITIEHLSKVYPGGVTALDSVDLVIGAGMFGLLGPNGSGKSTLMSILATLMKPSAGRASIDGFDVADERQKWLVKRMLGYLPQELGLYPDSSPREFLEYIAILKGLDSRSARRRELERLLSLTGLERVASRRIRSLSGGMKRRLGIAQALIGDPRLLIIDEPTVGLDPEERVRVRTLLADLAGDRIVILSTHIVEDVAATCTVLAVLARGRILFAGSTSELLEAAQGMVWEVPMAADGAVRSEWRVVSAQGWGAKRVLRIVGARPSSSARAVPATLEEAYLALVGGRREPLAIP